MMNAGMSNTYFDDAFRTSRAMGILRGYDADTTLELACRAWDAGIGLIEVPLQDAESERSMRACIAEAGIRGTQAGAGTIISIELVERAAETGAAFTVAPGLDLAVAARSIERGMPHLAGVGSATEVQQAAQAGLRWLKAFPARELGAPWIAAMRGPFPEVRFVATGGVDGENARGFLEAGAGAVSLGAVFAQLSEEQLAVMAR